MTVSGTGTTYNLPQYHGELFTVAVTQTPFLSAIGGINGAKVIRATRWEWQTIGRRSNSANNVVLEGQDAPDGTAQVKGNVYNVTEIHHSAVELTYSKLAATSQYSGLNVGPEWDEEQDDEYQMRINAELQSIGVDVDLSFLSGTMQVPSDNTTTRKTQGILGAITSNVSANGGTKRDLDPVYINQILKSMRLAGAPLAPGMNDLNGNPAPRTVFLCGSDQKLNLTDVYTSKTSLSAPNRSMTVAGMAIDTVVTPFGTFGILEDPHMPDGEIAVVDLAVCVPVFTEIPGKGVLFTEPLAKTGAKEKEQIYGEIGLQYGAEKFHGLIKDLNDANTTPGS